MEEKKYDLEERTERFAKDVRQYCKSIKVTIINADDIKQVLRSSGSMCANYIEANEGLSKKDFINRIKICRKESKETRYWFNVMLVEQEELKKERDRLFQEATELMKIFAAILRKSEQAVVI
jgi:four helix bundle protein